ncbi:hypothetical protein M422DRAFT_250230 [Sphaerobolus stellatus SS14]|uniref:Uncharacterized protein n=1 Tax=Sphaerobolus stellatus (strain SS14) TaxID=990650 RepID=A0A0C9W369_SPHS4|nr:hypothetical protein M422DRAFT_250230 [Sphaerobolus stellatus SS14]
MEKDAVEDLGTNRESSDPAIENLDSGHSQGAFEGTLDRVDDDREAPPQDVDERSNSHVSTDALKSTFKQMNFETNMDIDDKQVNEFDHAELGKSILDPSKSPQPPQESISDIFFDVDLQDTFDNIDQE